MDTSRMPLLMTVFDDAVIDVLAVDAARGDYGNLTGEGDEFFEHGGDATDGIPGCAASSGY